MAEDGSKDKSPAELKLAAALSAAKRGASNKQDNQRILDAAKKRDDESGDDARAVLRLWYGTPKQIGTNEQVREIFDAHSKE